MGQMEFRADRGERSNDALWTGYAVGVGDEAAARKAVASAREYLTNAENAHHLVTAQAIRSLSQRGLSTRGIADIVGISKSAVSRHLRQGAVGVAVRDSPRVVQLVREAWDR